MKIVKSLIICLCFLVASVDILSAEAINRDQNAIIFEAYDKAKNLNQRKERLEAFALYLRENSNLQGFIISYEGRRARFREASERADYAKNYLVKKCGIKAGRIVTLDGGYHEEWSVELWAVVRDSPAPTLMPTVEPSEVQIITGRKAKTRNRPIRRKPWPAHNKALQLTAR